MEGYKVTTGTLPQLSLVDKLAKGTLLEIQSWLNGMNWLPLVQQSLHCLLSQMLPRAQLATSVGREEEELCVFNVAAPGDLYQKPVLHTCDRQCCQCKE